MARKGLEPAVLKKKGGGKSVYGGGETKRGANFLRKKGK